MSRRSVLILFALVLSLNVGLGAYAIATNDTGVALISLIAAIMFILAMVRGHKGGSQR